MRIGYACDAEILKAGLCAVSEYIKTKIESELKNHVIYPIYEI